jgi:hypothetical protein
MKRRALISLYIALLTCAPTVANAQREETETTIVESGYYVAPAYAGKVKIIVALVVENPYQDKFASRPNVRVTARAADGSVITTQEMNSAGIPPKQRIAYCNSLYADEMPAKVEFRALSAGYEPTVYKPVEFLPLELIGVRSRIDNMGRVRITGEIKNPFPLETGGWITFLYRNTGGKLIGGHTKWISEIPAGEPTPFEMYVDADEVPSETKSIEKFVFNHNNYQSSWQKLLKR